MEAFIIEVSWDKVIFQLSPWPLSGGMLVFEVILDQSCSYFNKYIFKKAESFKTNSEEKRWLMPSSTSAHALGARLALTCVSYFVNFVVRYLTKE